MSDELYVIENGVKRGFISYMELLEWAVGRTYEIAVNSPEEYEALSDEEKFRLDSTHEIWID